MERPNGKTVQPGITISSERGWPATWIPPFTSVIAWFGTKPAGRFSCLGSATPAGITIGFDMLPPIPQHVEVISLARSHFCYFKFDISLYNK